MDLTERPLFLSMRDAMKQDAQLRVKVTPELKDRLKKAADRKDRSVSWLVKKYITAGLAKDERGGGGQMSDDL